MKEEWALADHRDLSVSLICASQSLGGTEQIVRLLAKGFHERQAPVSLLTMGEANVAWLSSSGVPASTVPALESCGTSLVKQVFDLRKRFRSLRKSVVNIHYPTCDIYRSHIIGLRLAGCRKIVVSLHHPHQEWHDRSALNRRVLRQCQAVVVTTQANRRFVLDHNITDDSLLKVIHPGIEAPETLPKEEARRRLGLPNDRFIVGILCRMATEKRVDQVIEACRLADPEGDKVHLVIGGQGPESERIAKLAQAQLPGRHTVLGWQENTNVFYSAIDLFAMLSELEGFGLAYVEAAAHGVPSIGCDSGGTGDAILNGQSGYIVPVDAPAAPAAAHIRALAEDAQAYKDVFDGAARHYADCFTLSRMLDSYRDLYAQVDGNSGA